MILEILHTPGFTCSLIGTTFWCYHLTLVWNQSATIETESQNQTQVKWKCWHKPRFSQNVNILLAKVSHTLSLSCSLINFFQPVQDIELFGVAWLDFCSGKLCADQCLRVITVEPPSHKVHDHTQLSVIEYIISNVCFGCHQIKLSYEWGFQLSSPPFTTNLLVQELTQVFGVWIIRRLPRVLLELVSCWLQWLCNNEIYVYRYKQ